MKRSTEEKLGRALAELAAGLHEIGEMGILELRFKFKPILARVEKRLQEAVMAMREDG